MKTITFETVSTLTKKYCSCGKELIGGNILFTDPPMFEHRCECGKIYNLNNKFPATGYIITDHILNQEVE